MQKKGRKKLQIRNKTENNLLKNMQKRIKMQ